MSKPDRSTKTIRCAIYTRKSSEEGLDQAFNSLHAQREACEAYIRSQKHEGWTALPAHYDDGGYSGGTMERPALASLIAEIRAKKVDVVVVYKIDRLTRSLFDFAKIVEVFDAAGVSFVSVTQQFNTTTSMGRLTLNVLLSFAQFEREVTGERIRDKIAASKKKGMWMGGHVPLGYEVKERTLVIAEKDAGIIRQIFAMYLERGNVRLVKEGLDSVSAESWPTAWNPFSSFSRGYLYKILSNPIYSGLVSHKGKTFEGLHEPIIAKGEWDTVQRHLQENASRQRLRGSAREPSPLAGLLFDHTGDRLTPSHAVKSGKRYRYYIANRLIRGDHPTTGLRLPAAEVESAVASLVVGLLMDERRMFELSGQHGMDAKHILETARSLTPRVLTLPAHRQLQGFKPALKRVIVSLDALKVTLSVCHWMKLLVAEQQGDAGTQGDDTDIDLTAPLSLRHRGRVTQIVLGGAQESSRHTDRTLLASLARGYAWRHELISNPSKSASAIALRENVTPTYVSRLVESSFLAPDVLEDIASGSQLTNLTFYGLRAMSDIPLDWSSQRRVFG